MSEKKDQAAEDKAIATRDEQAAGGPGRTIIEDTVVTTIAAIAAREVSGVYDMGSGGALSEAVRNRIPGSTMAQQHGVSTEVGETQAAVDISLVAEYGVAIHELAAAVRRNVIVSIERMTGLEVTEVNVTVHDINLDDGDSGEEQDDRPARVN
ncbi:Asp23/Gls24 family envelope stress response protein [Corynebacterium sphenisci]|uniref:Asp23/Gls24 family envelope stress response protein n=1 Tax=Corynebacterium sphenisci TaxID=191493 RepID=UPI0026DF64EB|nr:Asp23/Gls24 family envelope stress response protein [Corynebacterium sphenisci]MDO5731243.1 Asp23/Gls24 family envelope stress response protein [Corynebacterium sphenisci]